MWIVGGAKILKQNGKLFEGDKKGIMKDELLLVTKAGIFGVYR
jgi:hypothetical protein